MKVQLRIAVAVALSLLATGAGCNAPPVWHPATTQLEPKSEIPTELPGRGMPGFVLGRYGHGPGDVALAVVDTGAPAASVTQRYAKRMGLKPRATSRTFKDFQGKEMTAIKAARVPAMSVGGAT